MLVQKKGLYRLTRDFQNRGSRRIGTLKKGTLINVTQIDFEYHKVMADQLADWNFWELPLEPVVLDNGI